MLKRWDILLWGESHDGQLKFIFRVFCSLSRLPEERKERRRNDSPQQAMFEMNVHLISLCSKSSIVIPHAHKHTNAVRTERPLLLTQTHEALAICISQSILFYTNDVFLYSFYFHLSIKFYGFYEWGFFFSRKNLLTLTVNFCTFLFIFFFKLRYVSVKKQKNKNEKKNCLRFCCKWCLLMSSGAVVDSVCSLDQTVLQGATLGDSGHESIKISWAAVC